MCLSGVCVCVLFIEMVACVPSSMWCVLIVFIHIAFIYGLRMNISFEIRVHFRLVDPLRLFFLCFFLLPSLVYDIKMVYDILM